MKKYCAPEIHIEKFSLEDVITTSSSVDPGVEQNLEVDETPIIQIG